MPDGNAEHVRRVAAPLDDNRVVPVLMSDGGVIAWEAPPTVNIPWGYPGDTSHGSGVEYSLMGREALWSMCEQN